MESLKWVPPSKRAQPKQAPSYLSTVAKDQCSGSSCRRIGTTACHAMMGRAPARAAEPQHHMAFLDVVAQHCYSSQFPSFHSNTPCI